MMRAFWRCVVLSSLLAAGGAEAQTVRVTDEIPGPSPYAARDDVVVGRGPYAAVPPSDMYGEEIIPPFLAVRIVRSNGYRPLDRPVRRGLVYSVAVISPQGQEGRAMLDAHTGRLMRFVPVGYGEDPAIGHGPPGPPPRMSTRSGPRPPANVPHVATRTSPVAAPAPTASPPSAATPDARPADAAAPQPAAAQQQVAASPSKPSADAVAAKPAPAPKPPVVLQPTQPLPPVQDFE